MNLQGRDVNHVWHPCSQMKDYEEFPPIVMERGEGSYLYDQEGKPYIDIISSWWCNLLGHCNPEINQAIKEQVDQLEHVIFADITHRPAVELTEALVDILPEGLTRFNFSDSGSAAVECALKMAFQYCHQNGHPEKNRLMCLSNGYHGETLGALSVGAMDQYAKIYKPLLIETISVEAPDCYRCPYGEHRDSCSCACFQRMEEAFEQYGRETCGIIVEPLIQGSAGMRIYPPLYLTKLRRLCNSYDVLLIADEIATGFGRTGKMFAFDYVEGSPDILCMSKGLTGGYMPMAITATTEKIYQGFYGEYGEGRAFMHSHTYSGNPLACSAALAVQRILTRENVLDSAAKKAEALTGRLEAALGEHPYVGEIRHLGLIHAIELVKNKETKECFPPQERVGYQIYRTALEKGLILRPLGDVLYFNPPLNIEEETLEQAVRMCKEAIVEILGQ